MQDPLDADEPSMPINAIRKVDVDHTLGAGEIGILLNDLAETDALDSPAIGDREQEKTKIEIQIAAEDGAIKRGVRLIGVPSAFSCPDCQGVMLELRDGKIIRFRCHTGHAYTAETFLETVSKKVEDTMWSAERSIEELIMLLEYLAAELAEIGSNEFAESYQATVEKTQKQADALRELIMNHDLITADKLRAETQDPNTSASARLKKQGSQFELFEINLIELNIRSAIVFGSVDFEKR